MSVVCTAAVALAGLVTVDGAGAASALGVLEQSAPQQTSPLVNPSDESSLRSAIAAGGIIAVPAGEYLIDEALTIGVDGTELRAVEPGSTTIRFVGDRDRVIDVDAANVTIDGITITGGSLSNGNGGGISIGRSASLTLIRSTVSGNTARQGGGIQNSGDLTVEDSTIDHNTADRKGGGLRNGGTATVVNSTFVGNGASQGGAVSSPGTTDIVHATIVRNVSTSSSSAGVDRNGGTLRVRYSIIGANVRDSGAAASDCSGTPDLLDLNLVSDSSGCNPVGTIIVASPGVGELADNGGPTATTAILDGSAAFGAIATTDGTCNSGIDTDQRGTVRPSGEGCELGAYERAPLGVELGLDVDTSGYSPLEPGVVEVGVVSVPTSQIAFELATRTPTNPDGTVDTAGLRSIGLRSIGLRSITLEDIGLRSIDVEDAGLRSIELKANGLRSIGLRSIGLRSIGLRSIGLRSIGLRSIGLRSIPLSEIPLLDDGGWEGLLAGTEFAGVPLQSITLEEIVDELPEDLTLESIDLSNTGLRSIGLRSILLSGVGLRSIPLPLLEGETAPGGDYSAAWCAALFGAELCDADLVGEIADAELWEAQLAGGDIAQERILGVPLDGLTSTGLRSIGLRSIGLRSIFLENTGLRSIGLRSIGLRSIDGVDLGTIIDCSAASDPCSTDESNTLTLGDAVAGCLPPDVVDSGFPDSANCLLQPDANVGQLLDLLGVEIDGTDLLDGLTLFDVLFAFVAPEDIPWEVIELDGALLQNVAEPPQPTFDYIAEVTVREGPADVEVTLVLPQGFAVASGANSVAATWCRVDEPTCTDEVAPQAPLALGAPIYTITDVPSGTYELRVAVRAGLTVGSADDFPTTATALAVGPNGEPPLAVAGPVGVEVVEATSGGPGRAPILTDGQLQLGHIASSDDIDVYSFDAPTGTTGASARILLSNIPSGVDYDLSVYGPRPSSLRQAPSRSLSMLGDVGYDLDPSDDVLPTDVVNDIAIDINEVAEGIPELDLGSDYALRDISSRRSNVDEEAEVPALVEGETYVVVVSTYLGELSPDPYGLRVRLDRRTALPACAAGPGYPSASAATVPADLAVAAGTNTLYVTNLARLAFEAPGSTPDLDEILDGIRGTDGINGVSAGLLLVDDLPEWGAWNSQRCDVDARNAVVSAIGDEIDVAITASGGSIEHLVIVGGDGVVPMAAVPDLTKYSNESTFAREVLSATGAGNEVTGTLGSGFLLSDDPYATDAGISILGGDHELYVPDRSIGRLVETYGEIVGQLDNFATYGGRLDPTTFESSAAVTGYDFLDDGASAIIAELEAAGLDVAELLDSTDIDPQTDGIQAWDKQAFLDLLVGTDYSVVSPNAHYDFESLLPKAADDAGTFTNADLVTAADLAGALNSSLVFSVGCHAGLSVSDVQLDLPALDWSQLNAQGANQWVAHTTYGYGDTEIVAYSERLAQLFAGNVAAMMSAADLAPTSLGEAVRQAKQRYLAGTLVLTPYDEKILQSWTYYGLPMYTLGDLATDVTADPTPVQSSPADASAALDTGPVTFGAPRSGGEVPVSIDLGGDRLDRVDVGDDGSYYQVDGNTIVAQYRPVEPLVDVPIPSPEAYQGFLITGLTSEDLPSSYVPFYSRPLVDDTANEDRIEIADSAFPATLQRVTDIGGGQRLLVAAGQYETGQRLFRQISGDLLPRNGSDDIAPRFTDIEGRRVADVGTTGRGIQFDIVTDGTADRVVVVFLESGQPDWRSVELAGTPQPNGSKSWFGSSPLVGTDPDAEVEFFAQSVDTAGNVGITSNKIENFLAAEEGDLEAELEITYVGPVEKQSNGRYFASGAQFVIAQAGDVQDFAVDHFSIDSGPPLQYNDAGIIAVVDDDVTGVDYDENTGELLLAGGPHVLFAQDTDGNRVYRFFILDDAAPTVSISPDSAAWTNGDVDVTITATDAAGAGVESVCINGSCESVDPVDGVATVTVPVSVPDGQSAEVTITASAIDEVGNTSTTVSTTTRIDRAAPTVSMSITPDGDGDGIYSVGELVSAEFSCADVGAGLASCELLVDGVAASSTSPVAIDTSEPGARNLSVRAIDAVGNTTTSPPVVVTVAYRTCLLYDSTLEKNVGSNYTIKVQLCDVDGNNRSSSRIPLTALTIDGLLDPGPNFSGKSNKGYEFRFTRSDSAYTYNLDTSGLDVGDHAFFFTTEPVPDRTIPIEDLQGLATNSAPFRLR